ncbi:MAG: hypothetical protein K2J12_01245 [Muribaculaceae bacterium]|nr:hypothetical protein [Muribaculaceae bacterium]
MAITLTKIASEIAKTLSLKHNRNIAYKTITQDDFRIIAGLCVEPSPIGQFSVHSFIQALYIPFPALVLELGDRVGYWDRVDFPAAIHDIKEFYEQLPDYDSIGTIIDMINSRQLIYHCTNIINKYEFLAYSYIVINQYDKAKEYLRMMVAFENYKDRPGWCWIKELVNAAKKLLDLMEQENWSEIRNLLLSWQRETMTALKLPD